MLYPTEALPASSFSTSASPSARPRGSRRPPRRSATAPAPLQPLTFAKVALSPAPLSACPSTSTDSECMSYSDVPLEPALSRSPSLLTSLIRTQTRCSNANTPATTPGVSPQASPMLSFAFPRCRPILRRGSENESDFVSEPQSKRPSLTAVQEHSFHDEDIPETLQRKRSCLKFAVTPRPLQLSSACSSRRTSPRAITPEIPDEDEPTTPTWSDEDDGYHEDSEDGFTSDDDVAVPAVLALAGPRRQCWGPKGPAPAPILSTSRRRTPLVTVESTDDCRPARIRIRDTQDKYEKCTRHRSPPPVSHLGLEDMAPPAARSPSAYELCRRRSGITEAKPPARRCRSKGRGWRSDEGRVGVKFDASVRGEEEGRPRALAGLVRRDSAPARVDEVTVLAEALERISCPRRGLQKVLGRARV